MPQSSGSPSNTNIDLEIDVEKRLGDFHIHARFTTSSGVTALFGPSGSGKSALMAMISGLIHPDFGHIRAGSTTLFDQTRRINIPAHKRRLGCVFQDSRLFPHMTVQRNMLYSLWFSSDRATTTQFEAVTDLLDVRELLDRRPADLSGGERQRVAIGRALLSNPHRLLMDEPLSALDRGRKNEILPYLERLRDEIRLPILYISHALEEVMRLADSMALIDHGRIIDAGSVESLTSRLKLQPWLERHEAGAVIETRVEEIDSTYCLSRVSFNGGSLFVPNLSASVGALVRVRLRSRDISLALEPPRNVSLLNILFGHVSEIGQTEDANINVQVQIGKTLVVACVTRKAFEALGITLGKPIYALIKSMTLDQQRYDDV
ncbi:Molybdenum import ATP-binding protein ModC [Azospirillaceae bacterium]